MSFFNQRNVASSIMELILLHHVVCTEIIMIHQDLSWGTINSCFRRCSYCVWKQAGCGTLASAAVKWWWLQNGSGKFENGNLMLLHTETVFIIELCYFPGGCCRIWVSRESVSNDYYYFFENSNSLIWLTLAALPYNELLHVMENFKKENNFYGLIYSCKMLIKWESHWNI